MKPLLYIILAIIILGSASALLMAEDPFEPIGMVAKAINKTFATEESAGLSNQSVPADSSASKIAVFEEKPAPVRISAQSVQVEETPGSELEAQPTITDGNFLTIEVIETPSASPQTSIPIADTPSPFSNAAFDGLQTGSFE